MHLRAYNDSLQSILRNDNRVSNAFETVLNNVAEKLPGKDLTSEGIKSILPTGTVMTNATGRILESAFGLPYGAGRAAISSMLQRMTPEEAELCIQAARRGGLSAGMFALGYANPNLLNFMQNSTGTGRLSLMHQMGASVRQSSDQGQEVGNAAYGSLRHSYQSAI